MPEHSSAIPNGTSAASSTGRTTKPERRRARREYGRYCRWYGTGVIVRLMRGPHSPMKRQRITMALALGFLVLARMIAAEPDVDWAEEARQRREAEAEAVRAYAEAFCRIQTEQVLRPRLEALGIDPRRYAFTFDTSGMDHEQPEKQEAT